MSATTTGALKAHLESQGLGLPFFRDLAPKDQPLPYATIQEGISITRVPMGDDGDPDADVVVTEEVQVTVWQAWRGTDGKPAERYDLPGLVAKALDGVQLPTAPTVVAGVRFRSRVRIPRVDSRGTAGDTSDRANIVQDVLTFTVHRSE